MKMMVKVSGVGGEGTGVVVGIYLQSSHASAQQQDCLSEVVPQWDRLTIHGYNKTHE
jgi:hypothetical protein